MKTYYLMTDDFMYLLQNSNIIIDHEKELKTTFKGSEEFLKRLPIGDFKELHRLVIKEYLRRLR